MEEERGVLAGRIPLDCVIFPGMFSTERRVVLQIGDSEYVTYADEALLTITDEPVEQGGTRGKIWVKVRRRLVDEYVVALPEETLSTGELVTVPKSLVAESSR